MFGNNEAMKTPANTIRLKESFVSGKKNLTGVYKYCISWWP
jgi:hypothetical protein